MTATYVSLLTALGKPQYLFRPRWALRRLLIQFGLCGVKELIELPWGAKLEVDTRDTLGHALALQGLYDIVTTEVVWRLTERGDRTFDVGANIGYFTTLLAHRVGTGGQVVAFEPHPETFRHLQRNLAFQGSGSSRTQVFNTALSDTDGNGVLDNFPGQFQNTSNAFLTDKPSIQGIRVTLARGEQFVGGERVGLMKIDAQFHEASVLAGFGETLGAGMIRDIVFEEERPFPAPSHRILLDAGYSIYWFEEHLRGPKMIAPTEKPKTLRSYDIMPSYLATLDSQRANRLLTVPGWQFF